MSTNTSLVIYQVLFKDVPVFSITKSGIVDIHNPEYMPADIYLETVTDSIGVDNLDTCINNITNFNSWAASRILNLDRKYAHELLNSLGFTQRFTDKEKAQIAIQTRCLSINDCYWLKNIDEDITFSRVNLFDNSLKDAVYDIALFGTGPSANNTELNTMPIADISTDGTAPKAWIRKDDGFYLLKGDINDSVVRETEASAILRKLGLDVTEYTKDTFKDAPVSSCKAFTNKNVNFVRAEWFRLKCMNNDEDIADYIFRFKSQFDKMNLADYLVGNTDEHAQNWGFLYDENLNIMSLNPPMDYDHAFTGDGNTLCLPMQMLGQTVTQEEVAIGIIKEHPDWIDFDVDLSEYKYGSEVTKRLAVLREHVIENEIDEEYRDTEPDLDNDEPDLGDE